MKDIIKLLKSHIVQYFQLFTFFKFLVNFFGTLNLRLSLDKYKEKIIMNNLPPATSDSIKNCKKRNKIKWNNTL